MVQTLAEQQDRADFYTSEESEAIAKLQVLRSSLTLYFKERDEVIEAMFAALLSRNHLVMIGPPGTGKSYLIECFSNGIEGCVIFAWQVTKFSTPEELFGPYSLMELKKGKYERVTQGKLPECNIAYIDEVFNANSSILNSLNSAMNERVFQGNPIPLDCLYGATNFIPEEKILVAFFDRFLFRFIVDQIHESAAFQAMLAAGDFAVDQANVVTQADLDALRARVADVDVSPVIPMLVKLRDLLKVEQIYVSDRRYKWALNALRARALLDARAACAKDDLYVLKHVLWSDKKEIPMVESTILKSVSPIGAKIKDLYDQSRDIQREAKTLDPETPDFGKILMEKTGKLKILMEQIDKIKAENELSPRELKVAEKLAEAINTIRNNIADKIGL